MEQDNLVPSVKPLWLYLKFITSQYFYIAGEGYGLITVTVAGPFTFMLYAQ